MPRQGTPINCVQNDDKEFELVELGINHGHQYLASFGVLETRKTVKTLACVNNATYPRFDSNTLVGIQNHVHSHVLTKKPSGIFWHNEANTPKIPRRDN